MKQKRQFMQHLLLMLVALMSATIAKAANYDFKAENGDGVTIYYKVNGDNATVVDGDEKVYHNAILSCKAGRFKEALEAFENLMFTSEKYYEKYNSLKFATSILIKKKKELGIDEYVRNYKLARCFILGGFKNSDYPKLNERNLYLHSAQYEARNIGNLEQTFSVKIPKSWREWIPYVSDPKYEDMGLGIHGRDVSLFYRNLFLKFRNPERTRFPKITNNLYGYVDEFGNEVISPQYVFAYPFDEKQGLALVMNGEGKWGYIDLQGRHVTGQIYDVASDVFVDGKTFVIKENYLMLIDSNGKVLKAVYGYSNIAHKLKKEVILVTNGKQFDLFDFEGNLIEKNISKNTENERQSNYFKYDVDKILGYYNDSYGCSFSFKNYKKIVGKQIINPEELGVTKIVDLGLSVNWAGWNIGANQPEEDGTRCGWADPTGKDKAGESKKKMTKFDWEDHWKSTSYGGDNPPKNICGTQLDIATQQWGNAWRMPTKKECLELIEQCKWEWATYKNTDGYLITGPTGKSIFLKASNYYWIGELDSQTEHVYVLEENKISNRFYRNGSVSGHWTEECRPCVRPVFEKMESE